MAAQDVQAGRAYISLYLRRANYDQQVDDLKRNEDFGNHPSQAVADTTEADSSMLAMLAKLAAQGAALRLGSLALEKSFTKLGITAATTAPAIAATGTAARGAAVGFGAMVAAAIPILVPLAAIAAAATLVYVALFKWEKLPLVVKALMVVLFPMVVVIRMAVLAFKALKLAVTVVTAPFWLAAKAVRAFYDAILAIPNMVVKTVKLLGQLSVAAAATAVKVARAAAKIAVAAAGIPGRLARATSAGLRDVGTSIARLGAIGAGIAAAIVGPAVLAAKSWAAYGEKIRGVQNDLLRYQLTAEEASIISRVAEQTGESMEELAKQIRGGGRDFSRWRNELMLSGTLMSGAGLSAALALSRAYYSLRESVAGLKNALGAALGPALAESAQLLTGLIRGITRWVNENKPLVVQVFKIASAVGIAAGAITVLGGAIAGAGTLITPLVVWLAAIAGVMAILEVRAETGQSIWDAYGNSVRRVYSTLVQYLGQMMEFAGRVIGGVKDALMAGDLALAVEIMWAGAKVAWISALREIDELTSGTFGSILQSLAAGRWKAAAEGLTNELTQAWINIEGAADAAWTGILSAFDVMLTNMAQGLHDFIDDAIPAFVKLANFVNAMPGIDLGIGNAMNYAIYQLHRANEKLAPTIGVSSIALAFAGVPAPLAREPELKTRQDEREARITALKQRQTDLAKESGVAAERERTANQEALDAALAAAQAAREAAAENQLQDSDFAIAMAKRSITRFSGEALGLSVGRGDDPAKRTAKLSADQLAELRGLRKDIADNQREILRLVALGGFQ